MSCSTTEEADFSSSFFFQSVLKSTQIITSAPISFATSTGRLFKAPPSTSIFPFHSTGANTPGIDMLARIANGNEPDENTTSLPSTRSTATQRKGIGRLEKSST